MSQYNIILVIFSALVVFMTYFILSIITANNTRSTRLSFMKLFMISFFLTPIVGSVFLYFSKKNSDSNEYHYKCPGCGYYFTEVHNNCPQCISDGYEYRLHKHKRMLSA